MKVVFASHTHLQGDFVVGSHHLARALAREGHDILHLSTPVTPLHLGRIGDREIRIRFRTCSRGVTRLEPHLVEMVPLSLVPGALSSRFSRSGNLMLSSIMPALGRQLRSQGFDRTDLLIVDQPYFSGLWQYTHASCLIYRPTDLYDEMTGNASVAKLEQEILQKANGAVCTSQRVYEHVRSLTDHEIPSMVLPNGVDFEHFSAPALCPPEYNEIPDPRAIYVGALDARFDWEAIRIAASSLPHVQFVLIGPPTSPVPFRAPNVHVFGSRPFSDLPGYMQHAKVGLLPLSDHRANEGRSPMKLFEYAAAGLPIVARSTSQLRLERIPTLSLYTNHTQSVDLLRQALQKGYDPAMRETSKQYASAQGWSEKARRLLDFARAVTPTIQSC